ncbi:MAG: hypothetical protein R2799_14945, partial [Crocinitomicaceae bacterium]
MKKLFISLSLLTGLYSGAQNTLPKCAEHTVINKWLQDNPDKVDRYRQSRQDLENFTQNFQNSNDSRSRGVVYTIPMVFHIIHDYGASNITDDQI